MQAFDSKWNTDRPLQVGSSGTQKAAAVDLLKPAETQATSSSPQEIAYRKHGGTSPECHATTSSTMGP
jgi:hypothetical protein